VVFRQPIIAVLAHPANYYIHTGGLQAAAH
jgi:hypothetical protein